MNSKPQQQRKSRSKCSVTVNAVRLNPQEEIPRLGMWTLEMVVKRIAGAVVYVSNSTIFIYFPGWNFIKSNNQHKQNTSDKNKLQ